MRGSFHICPGCGSDVIVFLSKMKSGIPCICPSCGKSFLATRDTLKPRRRGRTDNQRRSRDQEKRAAKRDGAERRPASGAMDHAKGDLVKSGLFLKECKETTARSFSVKKDVLDKVEKEAGVGETPVLEVEFQGTYPKKRVYVIPEWAFEEYMELKQHANEHNR